MLHQVRRDIQPDLPLQQPGNGVGGEQPRYRSRCGGVQGAEAHHLVQPVQQLWPEEGLRMEAFRCSQVADFTHVTITANGAAGRSSPYVRGRESLYQGPEEGPCVW